MNVIRKDATITNTDEEFPGSFEVVLSTPSKDRDGDELATEDWKTPLPDRITFDVDHGMSVDKTVGSGVPTIEDGKLIVRGTYSSLPRAQEVRTLVKEGHIDRTSVAFMSEKVTKDGKTRSVRELLNGAFVAIPSNREAVVLASKGLDTKAGARNSAADAKQIQAIHDAAAALGADCAGPEDDSQAEEGATGGKSVEDATTKAKYSAEQLRQMLAHGQAMRGPNGPSYPIADKEDLQNAIHAVGRGGSGHDSIRAYIIRRARALGASDLIPDTWNADGSMKAASNVQTKAPDIGTDPAQLAQAVDAALDEGWNLISGEDQSGLPEPFQQALGCFAAAWTAAGQLLEAMNVDDPDKDNAQETTSSADGKSVDADALAARAAMIRIKAASLA